MTATSRTTIKQWLDASNQKLSNAGIQSYDLDSLLLLEHVLTTNRASILAHLDDELTNEHLKELNSLLLRRLNREPIAYILGSKEFYGREFYVDEQVLIPRPESENFIELIKKHNLTEGTLIDVGCGSGILGITAKLEAPKLKVTLSDISNEALGVAEKNAKNLSADVNFKNQSLFSKYYDVILANLPYVPNNMQLEKELSFEPKTALFSKDDGLEIYRDFCKKVAIFRPKYILSESLEIQHQELSQVMDNAGYDLIETHGLVQLFKLIR